MLEKGEIGGEKEDSVWTNNSCEREKKEGEFIRDTHGKKSLLPFPKREGGRTSQLIRAPLRTLHHFNGGLWLGPLTGEEKRKRARADKRQIRSHPERSQHASFFPWFLSRNSFPSNKFEATQHSWGIFPSLTPKWKKTDFLILIQDVSQEHKRLNSGRFSLLSLTTPNKMIFYCFAKSSVSLILSFGAAARSRVYCR